MGMFSEIHAEIEASRLEKVLLKAIDTEDQKIITFCKEHLYPLYNNAVGDSFGLYKSENELKIKQTFEK